MVCAPSLLSRGPIQAIADLRHHTLLHDDSYAAWTRWLGASGVRNVNPRRGVICGDRNSMLQAAIGGQCVGVVPEVFAAQELAAGRLVKVFDLEVAAEFSIYAVCLPRRLNDPVVSGALDWLLDAARDSMDARPPAP